MTTTAAEATLEYLDPADLIASRNIRKTSVDAALTASIRQHNLLQPIVGVRNAEGRVVIRMGHRRQIGAINAGVTRVPVMVYPTEEAADDAERIKQQLAENDNRQPLTATEQAGAVQQLLDLGLTEADIARQTSLSGKQVTAARTVAGSKDAKKIAARNPGIDLEQLAAIDEFAGNPDAVKSLAEAAAESPGHFAHMLQRHRDARKDQEERAAAVAKVEAEGVKVLPGQYYSYDSPHTELGNLADAEGKKLTPKSHKDCPGHAAYVVRDNHYGAKGYVPLYVCTDAGPNGHKRLNGRGNKGKMSDAEKAERRTVVANNKAWKSAEQVRRTWLRQFCARATAPDDGLLWAMNEIAHGETQLTSAIQEGHQFARILLGLSQRENRYQVDTSSDLRDLIEKAKPGRRAMITLALVLGAYEGHTNTGTWRGTYGRGWDARYFRALAAWGYTLSDVEQIPVDKADENERKRAALAAEMAALRAAHDKPCTSFKYGLNYDQNCTGCGWTREEHLKGETARARADELAEMAETMTDPEAKAELEQQAAEARAAAEVYEADGGDTMHDADDDYDDEDFDPTGEDFEPDEANA